MGLDGAEKGNIENPHNLLVRGMGLFGPFFFSYGDDRKIFFYKPDGTVQHKKVEPEGQQLSEMEMLQ